MIEATDPPPATATGSIWAGLMPREPDEQPDGLDTITTVLAALKDGLPIPQSAAAHLARALRPALSGDNDIAGRLGLRASRPGGAYEAPANRVRMLKRDELITRVVSSMDGPAAVSALALMILWNYRRLFPEAAANHGGTPSGPLLAELAQHPTLSHRQILRIVSGSPAYRKSPKK
jgi:hypothetical protein